MAGVGEVEVRVVMAGAVLRVEAEEVGGAMEEVEECCS